MRIIWPEGNLGSKRSGILAIFIGALASAMLLAAGCAGDRTADQAAAEAVATISADATNESTAPSTRKSPHTTVGAKSTTTDLSTGSSATSPVKTSHAALVSSGCGRSVGGAV
jgi:Flp pilus assembly protein TadB